MNELNSRKSVIKSYKENYNENLDIEMSKEEMFIFIELFLHDLPESLDPLNEKFIPILPVLQVSSDTKECPFTLLKKWPYSRSTAYILKAYACLQKMLLTNDTNINFDNEINEEIMGIDLLTGTMLKDLYSIVFKYAIYILNSTTKEERKIRIAFTVDQINSIQSLYNLKLDIEAYCFAKNIFSLYNDEIAKEKIR